MYVIFATQGGVTEDNVNEWVTKYDKIVESVVEAGAKNVLVMSAAVFPTAKSAEQGVLITNINAGMCSTKAVQWAAGCVYTRS